jgi:NADPH:quinone reductase-like Zn-dependent oxidoreductase
MALDTVGGALFEPALRSLRFDGRMVGIFSSPEPQVDFPVAEIYNRQLHLTGLASVFMDGAYPDAESERSETRADSVSSVRSPRSANQHAT